LSKRELIKEVSGKVGITKKGAANVIDARMETITNALNKGEKIALVGFGTFQIMQGKSRIGKNPQSRETI